ncbi:hypothetical protein ElyMa_000167900 [Elysia marginata]|uniref:DUF7047 domain-containing protein n=1 Tax=Elysia marginata TaxID=1093978 RepID=A0AAV4EUZ5_9GAST|nr:hypothetical protein ElyMa_000167900 [Elysia marginata]
MAGWLRVACSYLKRIAEGGRWDDYAREKACRMLREMLDQVHRDDPVKSKWRAPMTTKFVIWVEASDLAFGLQVEIDGVPVEVAAWLRKRDDYSHINVAELEAALKGVNLGAKWGLKDITIFTDCATVCGWIKTTLLEERRVKTKGAAELLVKRRLGTLKNMIDEFELKIEVTCMSSMSSKADKLTRVKKEWLK